MASKKADFAETFRVLKEIFAPHADRLAVQVDNATGYTLVGRVPSTVPQHKKQPMWFGGVRVGKSYVSFHLMPLYMNEPLAATIPPALRKRMQGKSCFNFKTPPDAATLAELARLTDAGRAEYERKSWI